MNEYEDLNFNLQSQSVTNGTIEQPTNRTTDAIAFRRRDRRTDHPTVKRTDRPTDRTTDRPTNRYLALQNRVLFMNNQSSQARELSIAITMA